MGALIICAALLIGPTACSAPSVCVDGKRISDFTIDPNGSPCSQDCECNNVDYVGGCYSGKCSATKRETCKTKGEIRSCALLPNDIGNFCKTGQQTCGAEDEGLDGKWGDCLPIKIEKEDTKDKCFDNIDNDCDGNIDKFDSECTSFCEPGSSQPCYEGPAGTRNIGECKIGVRECGSDNKWGSCQGSGSPTKEECNGKDDDCNGKIDDTPSGCTCDKPGDKETCYAGAAGTQNVGICKAGSRVCQDDKTWGPCLSQLLPQAETCNGKDDDCDGKTDNDIDCSCPTPNTTEACYTGPEGTKNIGICSPGTRTCGSDGSWSECQNQQTPTPEICDGKDNDCDNQVDEGCINRPCEVNADCTEGLVCLQKRCQSPNICVPSCTGIKQCSEGKCICPETYTECDGYCRDIKSDVKHCGKCGQVCKVGESCQDGSCVLICPDKQTVCSGQCVDTTRDFQHCGACGTSCKPGQACVSGKCICPGAQSLCTDQCVDLQIHPKHCGGCDSPCKDTERCVNGKCTQCTQSETVCGSGCCSSQLACCSDQCIDTRFDRTNCGGCGKQCKPGEICCGGGCIDFLNDTNNCGGCGVACGSGQSCCNGRCVGTTGNVTHCGACNKTCKVGESCCGNACADLQNDANNCGACGKTCATGEGCCNGTCTSLTSQRHCGACGNFCFAGQTCCGSGCFDLQTDNNNCGACGVKCGTGESCCAGACVKLQTEFNHCGSCGFACQRSESCLRGSCVRGCTTNTSCPNSNIYSCISGECKGNGISLVPQTSRSTVGLIPSYSTITVAGNYSGTLVLGTSTLTGQGASDIYIAQYSTSQKKFSSVLLDLKGPGDEKLTAFAGNSIYSMYIAGTYKAAFSGNIGTAYTFDNPYPTATNHMFLLKRSTTNTRFLAKAYNKGGGTIVPKAVYEYGSQVYVLGTFTTTVEFGLQVKTTLTAPAGGQALFVASFNYNTGALTWAISLGASKSVDGAAIFMSIQPNLFVGGQFEGTLQDKSGTQKVTSTGGKDLFFAKLNASTGDVSSITAGGGQGDDILTQFTADQNQNLFITGAITPNTKLGNLTLNPTSTTGEAFYAKISSSGTFLAAKSFPTSSGLSIGKDILVDFRYIIVLGETTGSMKIGTLANSPQVGTRDIFLLGMKLNADPLWFYRGGGASSEVYTYGTKGDSDELFLYGQYKGTLTFNNSTNTSANWGFYMLPFYIGEEPYMGGENIRP